MLSEVGKGRTDAYGDIWSVPAEGPQKFDVVCLDKKTGAILWTKTAFEGEPKFKRHPKSSYAASTPAVDAAHVVAFFGTEGLYCYDHAGEQLWKKDLGELNGAFYMAPTAEWGVGSSPVIFGGRVYLQVRRDRPGVSGLLRRQDRRGALAHGARRHPVLGHADDPRRRSTARR